MSARKRLWPLSRIIPTLSGLVAVAWIATGVLGGSANADETYDRCMEVSDGTNADWSECGSEYLARLDGQLNDAWQRVFPKLTPAGQVLLRTEQRDWNTFKQASCLHYGNGDYGREGQVLHMPLCRAEIIEQRIDYLNELSEFVSPK